MALDMIKLGDSTYYFPGSTNIGLFTKGSSDAYLIDSGNDKEAGRKLLSSLTAAGLSLKAVINTHSNADHCGGNQFLQERTGCQVISPDIEAAFLKNPVLEPSILYGGMPPPDLMNKFFMAKPSKPDERGLSALPEGISPIQLPGHYFGMCGYLTCDQVFFAADCLFSKAVLDKYHIAFILDIGAFLSTLEMLPSIGCRLYIPSHAEPTEDISALATANRDKVLEIARLVQDACKVPSTPEDVLKFVFDHYGLYLDMGQYALAGATIRSYITYLHGSGKLERSFEGNRLRFMTISQ